MHLPCFFTITLATAAAALTGIGLSGTASAQGKSAPKTGATPPPVVAMLCMLEDGERSGWVPEVVMVTRQANGRVEVFDTILQAIVGKPIQAQVVADSKRERTYGWALAGVRNAANQRAERMDFRLTVRKADASAKMVVTPKGYDNKIVGTGLCGTPSVKVVPVE